MVNIGDQTTHCIFELSAVFIIFIFCCEGLIGSSCQQAFVNMSLHQAVPTTVYDSIRASTMLH